MLRKEEILERTSNGLAVFKHYLPGNWRIGRNFLNPLYEDSKASCNIYFDRRGGIYKMKDFGNDSYSGDCFFLVGQLKALDCNRAADFVEILEIVDRDLGLGLASGTPVSVPRQPSAGQCRTNPKKRPKKPVKPYQFREQKFPLAELVYWQQYGITPELLERYKVCSLREYNSETAEGKPYTYTSSVAEPMYGYKGKQHIKLYRPFSTPASSTAAASVRTTVSGWNNCQPKATRYSSRAARKTCFRAGARFSRYLLQQRNGDDTAHAGLSADIPVQAHRPAL